MKKYIPYVIIVVLLVVIAIGGTYIVMSNKNNSNTNINDKVNNVDNKVNDNKNDINNKEESKEKITLSEEELNKYLGYVPTGIQYSDIVGAYNINKATSNDLNDRTLITMAIYNFVNGEEKLLNVLNTLDPVYVNISDINKKIKEIYNKDIIITSGSLGYFDYTINGICSGIEMIKYKSHIVLQTIMRN
ncbi:MAG: hypothetical protein NC483_00095 [Ruminococcus sp.]|nr:hypothetical protein [Ruminococcus sp.]